MKKLSQTQIDSGIEIARKSLLENGKDYAFVYPLGFVPNSYHWKAPAERIKVTLTDYQIQSYDQKRSFGKGPYITFWNN